MIAPSAKHASLHGRRRVHKLTGEVKSSRQFYKEYQELPYERGGLSPERTAFVDAHEFYDPRSTQECCSMTLKEFLQRFFRKLQKPETAVDRIRPAKMQTRFTYTEGPMMFLGQQIVKRMKEAGYDAKILYLYRSPDFQNRLYAKGRTAPGKRVTNAKAFQSPHQYYEAVDIIHATKGWPKKTDPFWKALIDAAKVVEQTYSVKFKMGADWGDFAHVEMFDWRNVRTAIGNRKPSQEELNERFADVLPGIYKRRNSTSKPLGFVSAQKIEPEEYQDWQAKNDLGRLQAGYWYRTENGEVVGPIYREPDKKYNWLYGADSHSSGDHFNWVWLNTGAGVGDTPNLVLSTKQNAPEGNGAA